METEAKAFVLSFVKGKVYETATGRGFGRKPQAEQPRLMWQ